MRRLILLPLLLAASSLVGCDLFGDSAEKVAAAKEAEGRAIGGACRHAGRAIEDCYALNKKADKASVFAGWRDMNDYMRENKIEPVAPQLGPRPKSAETKTAEAKTEPAPEAAPADTTPTDKRAGKPGKAAKSQES